MITPDEISLGKLGLLHPSIRCEAIDAYNKAVRTTPKGVHPVITDTLRTFEQQAKLYAQGRTTPGPIVTQSKPGQSFHNYGLALDFALQINGKLVWTVDANWMKVVSCFKEMGFTSGLDWQGFKDAPHLQKSFGKTWKQLLSLRVGGKVDDNDYVIV